tara:strand:+ start:13019 stop:13201 length:183 start_codon:yes stop_codon:yes gene_type:complete
MSRKTKGMNYQQIIDKHGPSPFSLEDAGKVARHIPELRKVNSTKFEIHLTSLNDGKLRLR